MATRQFLPLAAAITTYGTKTATAASANSIGIVSGPIESNHEVPCV